jgi:K+-transporting ATPase ATPase B chain
MATKKSLWNTEIMAQALLDSVRKLDPRWMVKNPVMFVVEVGSVLTTALLIDNVVHNRPGFGFNLQITLWLWFTVLFANFAEAMAEGRGKAQADTLRKAKGETIAKRYTADGGFEEIASGLLRAGDIIYVEANHYIAGDGEVIEGVASSPPSPANPPPSSASVAATAPLSPAAQRSYPTGSRSASPPIPVKPSSTA